MTIKIMKYPELEEEITDDEIDEVTNGHFLDDTRCPSCNEIVMGDPYFEDHECEERSY